MLNAVADAMTIATISLFSTVISTNNLFLTLHAHPYLVEPDVHSLAQARRRPTVPLDLNSSNVTYVARQDIAGHAKEDENIRGTAKKPRMKINRVWSDWKRLQ
jgi:hypothetical protein